jgi:hypothetical protein
MVPEAKTEFRQHGHRRKVEDAGAFEGSGHGVLGGCFVGRWLSRMGEGKGHGSGGTSEANEQNIQSAYDPVVLLHKRGDGAL